MMFLDCPACLDRDGALRCGLPAEVEDRVTMPSTGGPVEILKISCPVGHWFNGPLESLTRHAAPLAALESVSRVRFAQFGIASASAHVCHPAA